MPRQRRGNIYLCRRLRESRDSKLLTQCISFPLCRRVNQQIVSVIMFNCSFCFDYSFQRSNKARAEQHDGIYFVTSHSTEDNAGWSAVLLLNFRLISVVIVEKFKLPITFPQSLFSALLFIGYDFVITFQSS